MSQSLNLKLALTSSVSVQSDGYTDKYMFFQKIGLFYLLATAPYKSKNEFLFPQIINYLGWEDKFSF